MVVAVLNNKNWLHRLLSLSLSPDKITILLQSYLGEKVGTRAWRELKSRCSTVVHVANGNKRTAWVIMRSQGDPEHMQSKHKLEAGSVVKHVSTGYWTNATLVTVQVTFEGGEQMSITAVTPNNKSIIIDEHGKLVNAHYSVWWERDGYSSIWRDTKGHCHNPNCPANSTKEKCEC